MKILWLTNIPAPYRVDFFNELGKFCVLTVVFERSSSAERDKSWLQQNFIYFKSIILKGINIDVDKSINIGVIKYLKKDEFNFIVISNPLTPTGIIAINFMKIFKINYIIEGDGGFPKEDKGLKGFIKMHTLSNAYKYFSTGKTHDKYYLKYKAKEENIVRYPFTSIFEKDIQIVPALDKKRKKIKLGMREEKIVISVGQYIYRKGFDVLLAACRYLDESVGVYIIGGTPIDEYIELINKYGLNNVHFLDFKPKDILFEYYRASDLFVHPTREDIWGLVINEAMANGLPIITTDKCIAGVELVENGVNGFIVPIENAKELANKINLVLSNDNLRNNMSINNLSKIKKYTIENMAKTHIEAFHNFW